MVGSGTRPHIDDGLLGITVFGAPQGACPARGGPQRPWREWTAPAFVVGGDRPVASAIDGEAARLQPPLRFEIHPSALRVRIARTHPGASPSALQPQGPGRASGCWPRWRPGGSPRSRWPSAAVNLVVKPLARRRRPDRVAHNLPLARHVSMPASRSMPSGHAASAFAFATGAGHVLHREGAALRMLAALVAYSRVHTGVHFPGDVVVGALLGTICSQTATRALDRRRA